MSVRKTAERPRKNTKLLTLFYKTQKRQPSLLSRLVMVSANFFTTYRPFCLWTGKLQFNKNDFSLDFCIAPYSSKGSEIANSTFIFLDWLSQPLKRDLDSSWRENRLRTDRARKVPWGSRSEIHLSGRQKDKGSAKQLFSEALELVKKKNRLVS